MSNLPPSSAHTQMSPAEVAAEVHATQRMPVDTPADRLAVDIARTRHYLHMALRRLAEGLDKRISDFESGYDIDMCANLDTVIHDLDEVRRRWYAASALESRQKNERMGR